MQDISLIKLPRVIPFSKNISPVQLPSKSQVAATYLDHKSVVSGYGRTSDDAKQVSQTLNYVNMKVIANSECSKVFGSKIVTPNVICAKGLDDVKSNACLGGMCGVINRRFWAENL
jgi:Trypsin